MNELTRPDLAEHLERSDLFQDLYALPDAARYRNALRDVRGWRLSRGEILSADEMRPAAYVVLEGYVGVYDPTNPPKPRDPNDENAPKLRRIFGQWSALRGSVPSDRLIAVEPSLVIEVTSAMLAILLGGSSSQFQVEFFTPFLIAIDAISDAPPEILDATARRARFRWFKDGEPIVRRGDYGSTVYFMLAGQASTQLPDGRSFPMPTGSYFGELAVLTSQPRSATVAAAGPCLTMECNRIVFGDLRKKSKTLKELVEKSYRERLMRSLLASTPIFEGLSEGELGELSNIGTLETFDAYEPIFFQGEEADSLLIVINGTMTVVQDQAGGTLPLAWVGSNQAVGEMALLPEVSGNDRRGQTVTALQKVDAVKITKTDFERLCREHRPIYQRIRDTALRRSMQNTSMAVDEDRSIRLGWILETEHLAGNWVLAVDMNDCIRCGNCVAACEATHEDGQSRFLWSDMRQAEDVMPSVRLSSSCQHCEFALCMNVCPTTAIERDDQNATVYIDYTKCIRCGKCADPSQGCAYGSIQIIPAETVNPQASRPLLLQLLDKFRKPAEPAGEPKKDAKQGSRYPVKCDLCHTLPFQACVKHCPTGAVFRLDGHQQFSSAMTAAAPGGLRGNRPSGEMRRLYVNARFAHGMQAKKPGELHLTVSPTGPGTMILAREPESGVLQTRLNMYLVAPDNWRIGGNSLRQFKLNRDVMQGEDKYPITSPDAGQFTLQLAVYQGGLYLGRIPIPCPVEPAAAKAPPAAAAKAAVPPAGAEGAERKKTPKTLPPKA